MNTEKVPSFSVGELNRAIGNLLSRGFAPRFVVYASVSKCQLKNGHLWLTLTDGTSSITAVIWSSSLKKCDFYPKEEDGVQILGKLNFWENRANLVVQVIDIKPTLSTVLRQFEVVRSLLFTEGLIDPARHRILPQYPKVVAILTSVPSSAYADILRTAKDRWPLTKLLIFPIPVQGSVSEKIQVVLKNLANSYVELELEVLVLARGGGSREDLIVFDDADLCRQLAQFPIPTITGIGHEDDLTVADLVSDHRSATPTAAIVDLLPNRLIEKNNCEQISNRLNDYFDWSMERKLKRIHEARQKLIEYSPLQLIRRKRELLVQKNYLLNAFSPNLLLKRGFCIVRNLLNQPIRSIKEITIDNSLKIEFSDGYTEVSVKSVSLNQDK